MNASDFIAQNPVIILDGGTGTELQRVHDMKLVAPLWSSEALRSKPNALLAVHTSYLNAGAQIITTGTFRANITAHEAVGLSAETSWQDTVYAATIAKRAVAETGSQALIAGSIAPVYDCYDTKLPSDAEMRRNHYQQAEALVHFTDLLLFETVPTLTEAKIMVEASERVNATFALSFMVGKDGRLLDGTLLSEASQATATENRVAVGVNCSRFEDAKLAVHELMASGYQGTLIVYPNGISETEGPNIDPNNVDLDWKFDPELDRSVSYDRRFVEAAAELVADVRSKGSNIIIGGCCGVTHVEIEKLAEELLGRRSTELRQVAVTLDGETTLHPTGGCCPHHHGTHRHGGLNAA